MTGPERTLIDGPTRPQRSGRFVDFLVIFIRSGDSNPPDKISNPYIEEDTDIYADTGDPPKHAWIGWPRKPK